MHTATTAPRRNADVLFSWRWAAWLFGCVLLAVAVWFRLWKLDSVPGVNGDEAWYGVQAMRWLGGEPIAWRTPTGNPLNPFYFVPLTAVHAMWGVGFWQLRCVAALSGLLALVVNYGLARRALGFVAAVISTAILAVLPINLAYSRFGWDASQSLLFALPVVYCPLVAMRFPSTTRRWLVCGSLSYLAALVVHPTNVFLLPMLVIPAAMIFRTSVVATWKRVNKSPWRRYTFAAMGIIVATAMYVLRDYAVDAAARVVSPSALALFVGRYVELLSGVTTYRYIPGSLLANDTVRWSVISVGLLDLAVCVILGLVALGWRSPARENCALGRGLLLGWLFTAVGFFLVAGPGAIAPHFERYGICLIAPAVAAMSIGLRQLILDTAENTPRRIWILAIPAACCLFGFHGLYFAHFETTGGQSHRAFRTADREPKRSLIHSLSAAGPSGRNHRWSHTTLAVSEWWTYWPLQYLAMADDNLDVVQWKDENELADLVEQSTRSRICFVEFVDQSTLDQVRRGFLERVQPFDETVVNDSAGAPLLVTVAPRWMSASRDAAYGSCGSSTL